MTDLIAEQGAMIDAVANPDATVSRLGGAGHLKSAIARAITAGLDDAASSRLGAQGRIYAIAGGGYISPSLPGGSWSPTALFAASEVGAWYDPSDLTTMFQDSAGTTPVTAAGQPVGKVLDLSGNNLHLTQSTAAARPTLIGEVASLGDELAPALGASWTAGAGWTDLGVATTTTASLSTPMTLTAGKVYQVIVTVTHTAGYVYPQFTGGTAIRGPFIQASRPLQKCFIRAQTGNTTFALTGGANFSGTVSAISVKEVTAWAAPYGIYGSGSQLLASDILTTTLPVSLSCLFKSFEDTNLYSVLSVGSATNETIAIKQASPFQRIGTYVRDSVVGISAAYPTIGYAAKDSPVVYTGTAVVGTTAIQCNMAAEATGANSWVADTSLVNARIRIGTEDGNGVASGVFYGGVVVLDTMTVAEKENIAQHFIKHHGFKHLVVLGDSTTAYFPTTANLTFTGALVDGVVCTQIGEAGAFVSTMKTKWQAMTTHSFEDAVVIQIGLNRIDPSVTPATVIAEIQDLVNTVQADTSALVFIATMTPCKAYLLSYWGATNGAIAYQNWLDINESIAGNGANPITNVDARITSHTTSLNDGSGNLDAAYDVGDGIHINQAGRVINAAAWRAAFVTAGVLS